VKVVYRQGSLDDVTRQFRYYLLELNLPLVAVRFRESVRKTAKAISRQPQMAPPYLLRYRELQGLRS
jgi:hypothetical protein